MLRIGINCCAGRRCQRQEKQGTENPVHRTLSVRYYLTDSVRRKRSFISNKLKTGLKNYGGIRGSVSAKHNRQSVIIPGLSQSRGTDSYQVVIFNNKYNEVVPAPVAVVRDRRHQQKTQGNFSTAHPARSDITFRLIPCFSASIKRTSAPCFIPEICRMMHDPVY